MSAATSIEWTDSTWNPVAGCTKISVGCDHCYAERLAERFRGVEGNAYEHGFDLRLWPERLEIPLRWKKPRRIFVCSMADLFHQDVPDAFVRQVFEVMVKADRHTFQVLTKRSPRLASMAPSLPWPANVWCGVSVETMDYAYRVDHLRKVPAAVRFVSAEPILGPLAGLNLDGIDWVIAGGESGPRCRLPLPEWIDEIQDNRQRDRVAFFFKQWGGTRAKDYGRLLDGRTWDEFPAPRKDRT